MASSVRIEQLTKLYGDTVAAKDISLEIEAGEFVTLLGPSGSGKTTLLMMVAGFVHCNSGHIYIDSKKITNLSPNKRNIGMVFQNYALFPHMSVRKNIEYPLSIRRVRAKQRQELVDRIIDVVQLDGLAERMPAQLSGGQKQRVAMARALVFNPPVLLMDEPLSALDKKLREQMQLELKSIQEKMGITVLYVTHDQGEALAMSGRIAVMNHGEIQQVGTPSQIYHQPANRFISEFIGETNIFPTTVLDSSGNKLSVLGPDRRPITVASGTNRDIGIEGHLSVRPEKVRFMEQSMASEQVPFLEGIVEEVLFLGDSIKYFVRLTSQDAPQPLVVAKYPSNISVIPPVAGQKVTIGWEADDALFVI